MNNLFRIAEKVVRHACTTRISFPNQTRIRARLFSNSKLQLETKRLQRCKSARPASLIWTNDSDSVHLTFTILQSENHANQQTERAPHGPAHHESMNHGSKREKFVQFVAVGFVVVPHFRRGCSNRARAVSCNVNQRKHVRQVYYHIFLY